MLQLEGNGKKTSQWGINEFSFGHANTEYKKDFQMEMPRRQLEMLWV
jgi:hypothetical protein